MPMIYKVRDPLTNTQWFTDSNPKARKLLLEKGEHATLQILEYQYKWQLAVMLNTAYADGRDDVLTSMD